MPGWGLVRDGTSCGDNLVIRIHRIPKLSLKRASLVRELFRSNIPTINYSSSDLRESNLHELVSTHRSREMPEQPREPGMLRKWRKCTIVT